MEKKETHEIDLQTPDVVDAIAEWTPDDNVKGHTEKQIAEDEALEAELQAERQTQDSAAAAFSAAGLSVEELAACIETLLFLSDKPLSRKRLKELLGEGLDFDGFELALEHLQQRSQNIGHGIQLVEVAGGYQWRTKPSMASVAHRLVKVRTERLSRGAMETLAVIAYQQPVMKDDIDKVRGVDSSHFLRRLLEKQLIEVTGRSELPGRPMLYGTTANFLELFSLNGLSDLPPLREIEKMVPASEVGAGGENGEGRKEPEDPRVREMRKLVGQMNSDRASLSYDPRQDEAFLADIRSRVSSISTTTATLDAIDHPPEPTQVENAAENAGETPAGEA
jgi:segregation and condensation protein B